MFFELREGTAKSDHRRYFIELQPEGPASESRNREDERRREQAMHFIASVYDWLKNHDLDDRVSEMDVTAFGQIRITCEAEIINRIRAENDLHIAVIRPSAMYVGGMDKRH